MLMKNKDLGERLSEKLSTLNSEDYDVVYTRILDFIEQLISESKIEVVEHILTARKCVTCGKMSEEDLFKHTDECPDDKNGDPLWFCTCE